MVRQVVIARHGDVSVLRIREVPPAPLPSGGVRIAVRACGVNFADLMMRMGLYPEAPPLPFVPGYEVSGTVVEAGEEAARAFPELRAGTRVMAGTRFGGYADQVVVPGAKVVPLPEVWSFEDGAAFLVAFTTAWAALAAMARVRAGDRVFVPGVMGGVGLAALQIARAVGARVAGTCGGETKASRARALGVESVVDTSQEDVERAVRAWAPEGVDIFLEPRGMRAARRSLALLAPAGRLVLFGASEMVGGRRRNLLRSTRLGLEFLTLSPLTLLRRNVGVFGLNVLELEARDHVLAGYVRDLMEGVGRGDFRPVLDRAFLLEQAGEAHRYLHERRNIGKVVLTT